MDKKRRIREEMLYKLRQQSQYERIEGSEVIKQNVFSSEEYEKAKFIFTYVSTELEVDTWPIIKEALRSKKRVSVPVITNYNKREMVASEVNGTSELKKNKFGIYQPKKGDILQVDKTSLDLMLIPGVAFDIKGNRLGRGKGFFDEFLKDVENIPIFGLAFSFQVLNSLPVIKSDVPVTKVISD